MAHIDLPGCSATPLASYLKALAVFRIAGEQWDEELRGFWRDGHFVLVSQKGTSDDLLTFLLNEYRPTPIASPWNGGSGFYAKDKGSRIVVDQIRISGASRLGPYRDAVERIDRIVQTMGLTEKPDKTRKRILITACRNQLSDEAIRWMDAAMVMMSDGPKWPPLLGVGGNDGRLEFSANFMKHVVSLMDVDGRSTAESRAWLASALLSTVSPKMARAAAGQFNPGLAGGPNMVAGYQGESRVNPWDFVLAMEGSIVFAAAGTHRFGSPKDRISYPFTVEAVGAGHGGLTKDDELADRSAEMWLPVWESPATLGEIRKIFEEGRAEAFRYPAEHALEFAAACASFGVDRGIAEFHRYAFLNRAGKNYMAVPLGRVEVQPRPNVNLLADVQDWLRRARRYGRSRESSAQYRRALRLLEESILDVCQSNRPDRVNSVLVRIGAVDQVIGASKSAQKVLSPASLSGEWIKKADATLAFRIAVAIASLRDSEGIGIRRYLAPVELDGRLWKWKVTTAPDVVWAGPSLEDRMAALFRRRMVVASMTSATNGSAPDNPFSAVCPADIADIMEFLYDPQHDEEIDGLVRGMSLIRSFPSIGGQHQRADFIPAGFALMKLVLVPDSVLSESLEIPDLHVSLESSLPALLEAGRVAETIELAAARLRHSGIPVTSGPMALPGVLPRRISASLLIPVNDHSVSQLRYAVGLRKGDVHDVI